MARLPPTSSSTWLPESTTEWIASASIDDDSVSANATNLVTAMPRLAESAAMTARLDPPALTAPPHDRHNFPEVGVCAGRYGHNFREVGARSARAELVPILGSWARQFLHLGDGRHGDRVQSVGQ